jgi:hypothetical protein
VTIKGQHYISLPTSPQSSVGSSTVQLPGSRRSSASQKASQTSGSWSKDAPRLSTESTDGTVPLSAVSATSSFATVTSDLTEAESSRSGSPRRSSESPNKNRPLRVVNRDSVPPQKPVPKGPIPEPPLSKSPSPVLFARQLMSPPPAIMVGKPLSQKALEKRPKDPERGRDVGRSPTQNRSRSVPAPSDFKVEISMHDPFLPPILRGGVTSPESYTEPLSATSISTKSTMPPTPTTGTEVPLYYSSKPTYMIDNKPPAKVQTRPRANTGGSSKGRMTPISPSNLLATPVSSPSTTKVKFNPKVDRSPSPPPLSPVQPSTYRLRSPQPQSPLTEGFPWRAISPPPRKGSATPNSMKSALPSTFGSRTPTSPKLAPSTVTYAPAKYNGGPQILGSSVSNVSTQGNQNISPPAQYPSKSLPKLNTSVPSHSKQASPLSPRSPSVKSAIEYAQNRSGIPVSTRKVSPPPPRVEVTPRPPLPSQGKQRITSFITEVTTSSHTSHAPTASTKATSVSEGAAGSAKVNLRRRPTNPSLFPPLPPATLAIQKKQFEGRENVKSPDLVRIDESPGHPVTVGKDGRIWI